ncbi:MAG: GNAT family N-acetyltransferase [Saprospiraceae bacterium]|nr:MAG: GNAT family N-acetyltransferase [Saprospiraceae bacterium]
MKPALPPTQKKIEPADVIFRPIRPEDDEAVARLIRTVMTEYNCTDEGYSIHDPELDTMYDNFSHDRAIYWVVLHPATGEIAGGGGIGPLTDAPADTCELKKMYFYPELRGFGLGERMVALCLETAKKLGYQRCYLETVDRMKRANKLYRKMGFHRLDAPMGNTGHCSCEGWFLREF